MAAAGPVTLIFRDRTGAWFEYPTKPMYCDYIPVKYVDFPGRQVVWRSKSCLSWDDIPQWKIN